MILEAALVQYGFVYDLLVLICFYHVDLNLGVCGIGPVGLEPRTKICQKLFHQSWFLDLLEMFMWTVGFHVLRDVHIYIYIYNIYINDTGQLQKTMPLAVLPRLPLAIHLLSPVRGARSDHVIIKLHPMFIQIGPRCQTSGEQPTAERCWVFLLRPQGVRESRSRGVAWALESGGIGWCHTQSLRARNLPNGG